MKHFTQFETRRTVNPAVEGSPCERWSRTRRLIGDLRFTIALLEADIASEESRCGITDPGDAAYPSLARSWFERREKLKVTVASLEAYVSAAADAMQ